MWQITCLTHSRRARNIIFINPWAHAAHFERKKSTCRWWIGNLEHPARWINKFDVTVSGRLERKRERERLCANFKVTSTWENWMNGEEGRDNPQMMVPKKTNGNMIDGDTIVNMLPSFLAFLDKDLIRLWERTKEGSFFFSNYMERKGETNTSSHHPWDNGSKKKRMET